MKIGNIEFEIGKRTYVMGILNFTPDSFSDGGRFNSIDKALNHVKHMIDNGADIIDVGGESTKPNHIKITDDEEIKRVVPIIEAIKQNFDIPVSIDTYKSSVFESAVKAGVDFLNDIWGFKYDEKMADIAAKYNIPCCLMHNRNNTNYNDVMLEILSDIKESINIALSHGVSIGNIIIDPGIGFGKTYEQNLIVMNNLEKLKETFQVPVLLGTSRKSMIGKALGNVHSDQRCEGTVATTVIGIMKNCDFIRVHDIKENKSACLMTDAVLRTAERN